MDCYRQQSNFKENSKLTESIILDPYKGIGKPEALKHELAGKWSRRISGEPRIIYQIDSDTLKVYSLNGHY